MSREETRRPRCRWTKSDYSCPSTHQHPKHPFGGRKLVTSPGYRARGFSATSPCPNHRHEQSSVERTREDRANVGTNGSLFSLVDKNVISSDIQVEPERNRSKVQRNKSPIDRKSSICTSGSITMNGVVRRHSRSPSSGFRSIYDKYNETYTRQEKYTDDPASAEPRLRLKSNCQDQHGSKSEIDTTQQKGNRSEKKAHKERIYYTIRNRSLKSISPNPSTGEENPPHSDSYVQSQGDRRSSASTSPNRQWRQSNGDKHAPHACSNDEMPTNSANQSPAIDLAKELPSRARHRRSTHRLIDHLEMKELCFDFNKQQCRQEEGPNGSRTVSPAKPTEIRGRARSKSPKPEIQPPSRKEHNCTDTAYQKLAACIAYSRNSPFRDESTFDAHNIDKKTSAQEEYESDQISETVEIQPDSTIDDYSTSPADTAVSSNYFCQCGHGLESITEDSHCANVGDWQGVGSHTYSVRGFKQSETLPRNPKLKNTRKSSNHNQQAVDVSWSEHCIGTMESETRECDRCHEMFSLKEGIKELKKNTNQTFQLDNHSGSRIKLSKHSQAPRPVSSEASAPGNVPKKSPSNRPHERCNSNASTIRNLKGSYEPKKTIETVCTSTQKDTAENPNGRRNIHSTFHNQQEEKQQPGRGRKLSRKEIFNQYSVDHPPSSWHSSMTSVTSNQKFPRNDPGTLGNEDGRLSWGQDDEHLDREELDGEITQYSSEAKYIDETSIASLPYPRKQNQRRQEIQEQEDDYFEQHQSRSSSANHFSHPTRHSRTHHPSNFCDQNSSYPASITRTPEPRFSISPATMQSIERRDGTDRNHLRSHFTQHQPSDAGNAGVKSLVNSNQMPMVSEDFKNENISSVSNINLAQNPDLWSTGSQPGITQIDKNGSRRSQSAERFYEMIRAVKKRLLNHVTDQSLETDANSSNIAINSSSFLADYIVSLWENQWLCDVQVTVEGQQLLAHKLILAAFSDVFCPNDPHPAPSVAFVIPDSSFEAVEQIFRYMYTGNMDLTDDILDPVLKAALYMGVSEVVCLVQDIMRCADTSNIQTYMNISRTNSVAFDFSKSPAIQHELKNLLGSGFFSSLSCEEMETLLNDPDVEVESEEVTLRAVLEWVMSQVDRDPGVELARLLRKITLESIPPNKLSEIMGEYPQMFSLPEVTEIMLATFQYHALHCKYPTIGGGPKTLGLNRSRTSGFGSSARPNALSPTTSRTGGFGFRPGGARISSPNLVNDMMTQRCKPGMPCSPTNAFGNSDMLGPKARPTISRQTAKRTPTTTNTMSCNNACGRRSSGSGSWSSNWYGGEQAPGLNYADPKVRFCLNNSNIQAPSSQDQATNRKVKRGTLAGKDLYRSHNNNNNVYQPTSLPCIGEEIDSKPSCITYSLSRGSLCDASNGESRGVMGNTAQSFAHPKVHEWQSPSVASPQRVTSDTRIGQAGFKNLANARSQARLSDVEIREFDPIRSTPETFMEDGGTDIDEQRDSTFEIDEAGCPRIASIDPCGFTGVEPTFSPIPSRNRPDLQRIAIGEGATSWRNRRGSNASGTESRSTRSITPDQFEPRHRVGLSDSPRISRSLSFLGHDDTTSAFQQYNP